MVLDREFLTVDEWDTLTIDEWDAMLLEPFLQRSNSLEDVNAYLEDLIDRRGVVRSGHNASSLVYEANGGAGVEMTQFEPDASTYRMPYYYNTERNVLYRRVVTSQEAGTVAAHWKPASIPR